MASVGWSTAFGAAACQFLLTPDALKPKPENRRPLKWRLQGEAEALAFASCAWQNSYIIPHREHAIGPTFLFFQRIEANVGFAC